MLKSFGWLMAMGLLAWANVAAGADSPLLLQQPTISKSEVVFVYGGWLSGGAGGGGGEGARADRGDGTPPPLLSGREKGVLTRGGEGGGERDVGCGVGRGRA